MDLILALLLVFVVLQILDLYTTYKIISNGGQELNPVMRWVIQKFGLVTGISSAKAIFVAMLFLLWYSSKLPLWFIIAADIAYVGVIIFNYKSIK